MDGEKEKREYNSMNPSLCDNDDTDIRLVCDDGVTINAHRRIVRESSITLHNILSDLEVRDDIEFSIPFPSEVVYPVIKYIYSNKYEFITFRAVPAASFLQCDNYLEEVCTKLQSPVVEVYAYDELFEDLLACLGEKDLKDSLYTYIGNITFALLEEGIDQFHSFLSMLLLYPNLFAIFRDSLREAFYNINKYR